MQRNAVFCAQSLKVVSNSFATLWTVACQTPLSMGFSRHEYWNGLPFPPPGDLPDPETEPMSPALAERFFITESPRKPFYGHLYKGTLHSNFKRMVEMPVY